MPRPPANDTPECLRTPAAEHTVEIPKVKGSRFIATVAPARSPVEAEDLVEIVRGRYPDARHWCFAWRLAGADGRFRACDDGEPSGSAGRPILRQLDSRGLADAVLVVTRYFGGTKLGVGGLIRAYGAAAAAVLDEAPVRETLVTRLAVVTHGYEDSGAVRAALSACGVEPISAEYGELVRLVCPVPPSRLEAFREAIEDRTAGRVEVRPDED